MKRRVVSIITVLALCLSLCPAPGMAAGWEPDPSLCPHHQVHTEACGYVPPSPGQDCAHEHGENCFTAETLCVHQHTEDCYPGAAPGPEASLCTHECSVSSGCVTLTPDCPHVHDGACGYVPEEAGAPCTFVCRVCPIEELIGKLPPSVTPDNRSQVEEQLEAILALYAELTAGEQDALDLSLCLALQAQLDAASAPMPLDGSSLDETPVFRLKNDDTVAKPFAVADLLFFDTAGHSFTAPDSSAIRVAETGELHFTVVDTDELRITGGGSVIAGNGAGVEVVADGKLYIDDPHLTVTGSAYGLDIASGAVVKLAGGTYTGTTAAIRAAAGVDFRDLLESGYAYFDEDGTQVSDPANTKTVVVKALPTIA